MNKFLIAIAAFLLTIQFSNAQTAAGTQNLGLNLSYYSSKTNEFPVGSVNYPEVPYQNKNYLFSGGPDYSYFIASNLDIGASASYSSSTSTNSSDEYDMPVRMFNSEWSATVYLRKYFLIDNKFGIRTGPYISIGGQDFKTSYGPDVNNEFDNSPGHNVSAGIRLDLVYYATKRMGITAALADLSYQHYTTSGNIQPDNGNGLNLGFTSGLELSAFYIFR